VTKRPCHGGVASTWSAITDDPRYRRARSCSRSSKSPAIHRNVTTAASTSSWVAVSAVDFGPACREQQSEAMLALSLALRLLAWCKAAVGMHRNRSFKLP
jgi:hypothetical protein